MRDLTLGTVIMTPLGEIRTGTCSWTDPTLVKGTDWYPKKSMSAAERLAFYAAHYPVAEADSTYYFPPTPELTRSWAERTPDGFLMNVKAYSLLTGHPTRPDSLWPDLRAELEPEAAKKRSVYAHHLPADAVDEAWHRFAFSLRPLHEAGKLGAVLFQYPEWFTPKKDNRTELGLLRDRLGDAKVCVEFRSPRWMAPDDRERTLSTLRDHELALVVVDAPPTSGLETVLEVTSPHLSVVRFHGRNDDTWKKAGTSAAERFNYMYSEAELGEWVPRIERLATQATSVHALMNNCYGDYGVRNAGQLQSLLTPSS